MCVASRSTRAGSIALTLLAAGSWACGPAADAASEGGQGASSGERWSHQDWPTGHYRVVEGWPRDR